MLVFGEFDWHAVVIYHCKLFKMTSTMVAITGWGVTCFCYDTLHGKNNELFFFHYGNVLCLSGNRILQSFYHFQATLDRSDDIIILYHSNTSSCFGQILCQKQINFSMTGYTERTISLNAL